MFVNVISTVLGLLAIICVDNPDVPINISAFIVSSIINYTTKTFCVALNRSLCYSYAKVEQMIVSVVLESQSIVSP